MKKTIKGTVPAVLLCCYAMLAGGSLEGTGTALSITIVLAIVVLIVRFIVIQTKESKKSGEGLAKAKDQFGTYTEKIEYELGKFILYDESKHRILLLDSIVDSLKLRELKTTEKPPKSTVKYNSEAVTKTSTGSMAGRAAVGAVVAGPVGALIGGSTAKKKTIIKQKPEYHTIPGRYTIEVIDDEGKSRAKFEMHTKMKFLEVKNFIQKIIDKNTLAERKAKQVEEEKKIAKIKNFNTKELFVGVSKSSIEDLLIDSVIEKNCDFDEFTLSSDAVEVINTEWHANFELIKITIKKEIIRSIVATSSGYSAGNFQKLKVDSSRLAEFIKEQYGDLSKVNEDVNYDMLTEDSNCINVYSWNSVRIDVLCENGKYKYRFISQI